MNLIAFVIVAFLNFGCNNNNELVSKFEKKELPVYLNTEDYGVYRLFDKKEKIISDDLKMLQESCDESDVFKYGYNFKSTENFNLLLYSRDISEDTVYYKLATLDSKNRLISSINIMEYCGDGSSLNGRILNNLDVYTVKRERLPLSEEEKEIIIFKEVETKYLIEMSGIIKQISKTPSQVKCYKIGGQGEFIPLTK
jgi:hypothetical protein